MPSRAQRFARRLLHEVPKHDRATAKQLARALDEQTPEGARDLVDVQSVKQGLRWLRTHGLAEKYHPAGWNPSAPLPWRLTPEGELALEEKESNAFSFDRSSPEPEEKWQEEGAETRAELARGEGRHFANAHEAIKGLCHLADKTDKTP